MRQVDGLRALKVRVGRHRPIEMALGHIGERGHESGHVVGRHPRATAHEHGDVGRNLVVARARGVELAAHGPHELGQATLDRHVDVLVVRLRREAA
jgi:hypothetical protein